MKVCEKVQRKGTTSYNEVADELVSEFTNSNSHLATDSVSEHVDYFFSYHYKIGCFIMEFSSCCCAILPHAIVFFT